jgi:hypothetical protein
MRWDEVTIGVVMFLAGLALIGRATLTPGLGPIPGI